MSKTHIFQGYGVVLTPFERNLELWRQLWRVVERSDLVVTIVDARNPVLFRNADLEDYVKEVDQRKGTLLLVNKADLLTAGQLDAWREYFKREHVPAVFWYVLGDWYSVKRLVQVRSGGHSKRKRF